MVIGVADNVFFGRACFGIQPTLCIIVKRKEYILTHPPKDISKVSHKVRKHRVQYSSKQKHRVNCILALVENVCVKNKNSSGQFLRLEAHWDN